MYSADPFMVKAREYLEHQVSQQAIEEVQEIREQDERYQLSIQKLINALNPNNEAIAQLIAATQYPTVIFDELTEQLRAATQYQRWISNELMAQIITAGQFPYTNRKLRAHARVPTQLPNVPLETKELKENEEKENTLGEETDQVNE